MVARIWRGAVRADDADEYVAYVRDTGVEQYRSTPGNHGAWILRRSIGDLTEILAFSLWESMDAVRGFAGDDRLAPSTTRRTIASWSSAARPSTTTTWTEIRPASGHPWDDAGPLPMFSLLWPLGLFVLSALDAAGLPVPAEAPLVARSTTGGATAVALLAAWIGFTVGDVAAFELWRHGWRRAPERWQAKATRLHFHELGPFSVALTRLLPISFRSSTSPSRGAR